MGELQTSIEPNLSALSDQDLEALTAGSGPFSSAGWYRMLERLDLPGVIGGDVELEFALVSSGGVPVAVSPLLRARGASLFEPYSVRRFYFESWVEYLRRSDPEWAAKHRIDLACIAGFCRVLKRLGCSLDDYLLVFNPLSFRSEVSVAEVTPQRRSAVLVHLISALRRHACEQGRPLWFRGVDDEDAPLSQALHSGGFQRVFLTHDNRIDLSRFDSFEDYLKSFKKRYRYNISREMRINAESGVQFRWVEDIEPYAEEFSQLYQNTYKKHQDSNLALRRNFWISLAEELQSDAHALVAEQGGRLIGFQLALKSDARREIFGYKVGRRYNVGLDKVPLYFQLSIYEAVREAIEQGCRAYWVGPGLYDVKSGRGAEPRALYNHFWFPQRRDRWLLSPYLQQFGEFSRDDQLQERHQPFRAS